MAARSAGILLYRIAGGELQVLLAHPGGPFWSRRDAGAWMMPKGEIEAGETAEQAARREFAEELGAAATGALQPLGELVQKGGKRVVAFALAGEFDVSTLRSNACEIEWPPRSGRRITIPEIDRVAWMPLAVARDKILPSQAPLLDRLQALAAG